MIRIVVMLLTGILWLLQGYVFGFQFPFVEKKPVLIVLGQTLQGLSLLGGIAYILLGVALLYEKKSKKENFEISLYYNIMMVVGLVLVVCTTL